MNANKKNLAIENDISDSFTDEEYNDTTKGLDCCLINFVDQIPEEYRDIIVDVEMNGLKQKDLTEKCLVYSSIRSRVRAGRSAPRILKQA